MAMTSLGCVMAHGFGLAWMLLATPSQRERAARAIERATDLALLSLRAEPHE
jgi:hypothetical protein